MAESRNAGAVITAVRAGAEGAWEDFLAAYGRRLYGYFFRATGSHHEAEDLLGEIMLRLVRKMGEYDDRGRFEPWLFRIAANLVRDRIRRARSRLAPMSLDSDDDEQVSLGETVSGPAGSVDAGLLAGENHDALAEALEKLSERSRQMVLLRHFGDMSYSEIAEIYDCPVGTVLARVHRALKTLRTALEASDEHA
ncbi:MAG: sigma-70 family RNA polymerase sigma factor [Planctomycetota bacterium]|nr:sigma-70 family RNA polymerase sigma factor [Planctomycetota bacterium]